VRAVRHSYDDAIGGYGVTIGRAGDMADRRGSRWGTRGASAIACGALVLSGMGVTASGAAAASRLPKAVSIQNYLYNPYKVKLKVGRRVTWTNYDMTGHTVTFTTFGSKTLAYGATYTHKFTTVGTFSYHCALHPDMVGKVVVVSG
jgi:plastocyanin